MNMSDREIQHNETIGAFYVELNEIVKANNGNFDFVMNEWKLPDKPFHEVIDMMSCVGIKLVPMRREEPDEKGRTTKRTK